MFRVLFCYLRTTLFSNITFGDLGLLVLSYDIEIMGRDRETVLHLRMLGRAKGIPDSTAVHVSIPPGLMQDTPACIADLLLAQVTLRASCCCLD